jgi:NTP pyrophosphatase (non-canonical NTP hydrolase)
MSDKKKTIQELKDLMEAFVKERDWQQFHKSKNLSMALSVEASELVELFQWLDNEEAEKMMKNNDFRSKAIDEIADILLYAIAFANRNDIDISKAIEQKLKKNKKKYPSDKFKGRF